MALMRAYSKFNEVDRATIEHHRRKTRRRVSIIAVSTLILVAIVIGAVLGTNHGSDDNPSSTTTTDPLSTSIKAVCETTLYPGSCLASLSPLANSTGLDPLKLFHLSVQVAMDELSKALKHFQGLRTGGPTDIDRMSLAALSNCEQLLGLAIDHLSGCISSTDLTLDGAIDDLRTWLSASITDQHTCIDGFANATTELSTLVAAGSTLRNSAEFTSNSLAILGQFASMVGSIKLRRLMSHSDSDSDSDSDGSPSWLSPADRRLLAEGSSVVDPRKVADLVVAKDGSGNYQSITAALSKVPPKSNKRFVIYVKKGIYYENVRVDSAKWNVMMVGDGMDATIVSGRLNFVDGTPTYSTATFAVFGKGFMGRDMGFRNTAGAVKHQAVALLSDSDRSVFYRCKFDAYQDTLYTHSLRQFYRECNIYGTVDFIFGNAAVVFQTCNILPRVPIPGQQDTITAQGKVDPNQNTGISFHGCTLWPFGNLTGVQVYLGRPWKPYSTTVFMRTMMAGFISPAGWLPWIGNSAPDTIFYSEYGNFGPGSVTRNRVKWKGLRSMNSQQAAKFTVGRFIEGSSWIPKTGVPFNSGL